MRPGPPLLALFLFLALGTLPARAGGPTMAEMTAQLADLREKARRDPGNPIWQDAVRTMEGAIAERERLERERAPAGRDSGYDDFIRDGQAQLEALRSGTKPSRDQVDQWRRMRDTFDRSSPGWRLYDDLARTGRQQLDPAAERDQSGGPDRDAGRRPATGGSSGDAPNGSDPAEAGPSGSDSAVASALKDGARPNLQSASQRGLGAAGALKGALGTMNEGPQDLPAGAGGARALGSLKPGGPAAPAAGASAPFNLANPATREQVALAASGPYRETAEALGLRSETGPDGRQRLLRADGSQASERDVSALSERIRDEPTALVTNENFFKPSAGGIARENFFSLKDTYKTNSELRQKEFGDAALSESERDFVRPRSCELASGDCENADKSFKKDELVPAKKLSDIFARIRAAYRRTAELQDEREKVRNQLAGNRTAGIGGRLMRALDRIVGRGERGPQAPQEDGPGLGGDAPSGSSKVSDGRAVELAQSVALPEPGRSAAAVSGRTAAPIEPSGSSASRRGLGWLVGAGALLLGVGLASRRS